MAHAAPSDPFIDLPKWVESARANNREYRRRQIVEIVIKAISSDDRLRESLLLKGGTLMNLVYDSPRGTTDVDFTTRYQNPHALQETVELLNGGLEVARRQLGYLNLMCRVQGYRVQPPRPDALFPTATLRIASAEQGSSEARGYEIGQATHVTKVEVSFNEYIGDTQVLTIDNDGNYIFAYSLTDLIAEKLRAYLQQEKRNRRRRQDIYDLSRLIRKNHFDERHKLRVLQVMVEKSHSRGIYPNVNSMETPELIDRARSEYETIAMELKDEILDFDVDFQVVKGFYKSLPWNQISPRSANYQQEKSS